MKGKFHIAAAILAFFVYLVSISGLDLHHCAESGRTYLALPIFGISCEDIHPEDSCPQECTGDEDDCCSDVVLRVLCDADVLYHQSIQPFFAPAVSAEIPAAGPVFQTLSHGVAGPLIEGAPPGDYVIKYRVLRV